MGIGEVGVEEAECLCQETVCIEGQVGIAFQIGSRYS